MAATFRTRCKGQLGLFDPPTGPAVEPALEADPDTVRAIPAPDLGERHYGSLVWVGRHGLGQARPHVLPSWCVLLRVTEITDPQYPDPLYELRVRHADGSVFTADRRLTTNAVAVAARPITENGK